MKKKTKKEVMQMSAAFGLIRVFVRLPRFQGAGFLNYKFTVFPCFFLPYCNFFGLGIFGGIMGIRVTLSQIVEPQMVFLVLCIGNPESPFHSSATQ
jgi:hypothetical protein